MASTYLTHTGSTPTLNTKCTLSVWLKRSKIGTDQTFCSIDSSGSDEIYYRFRSDNQLQVYAGIANGQVFNYRTNRLFRDVSAWYNIVIAIDTTASSGNRMKIYVNGEQETSFQSSTEMAQDSVLAFLSGTYAIGRKNNITGNYYDGYITHAAFVDGQALTQSAFGETDSASGIWKFKSPSTTWGTNGFHLKFENSGAMGTDSSGQSNTFTVNGSLTQSLDTPSNNYCTFSPLHFGDTPPSDTYGTFSNGNTRYESSQGGSPYPYTCSTLAASSGKWYAEFKLTRIVNSSMIGITDGGKYTYLGNSGNKDACLFHDGNFYPGNSSFGNSFSNNDICGVAMDLDNMKVYFSKNGTWQNSGDPTSGSTGTGAADIPTGGLGQFHFAFGDSSSNDPACSANFGSGFFGTTAITSAGSNGNGSLFEYDVPSGYYALNTKNLNTYG
tara:strand:- start:494 stop:1816 length:1323 start_codon:yes stop_codon:yes gene_type:complete